MIKRIIKGICHKLYTIGKFEELRRNEIARKRYLSENAVIGENVYISSQIELVNISKDRNKIKVGNYSRIMGDLQTLHADGEIKIGDHCFFGQHSRIWSARRIEIGNRVLISHNVNIHDNISHPIDWELRHEEFIEFVQTGMHKEVDIKAKEIIIEDDVWIGFNAIILRGVRIGRGAIIGAGAVVVKDVEPWTVNVGNPLRCVNRIEPVNNSI